MAGIDKTYTDSFELYKQFKVWTENQTITFYNGHTVKVYNFVYIWDEIDFDGEHRPIMNTPSYIDIYLIQNCPFDFVLQRMLEVYGEDNYNEFKTIDLSSKPPENFKQNRKITICRRNITKFPIHKKPYDGGKWWLQCNGNFMFCDETNVWSHYESYYPQSTNTAHISSLKGVVRHLRKQYLPSGITFCLSGGYIGEDYLVLVN